MSVQIIPERLAQLDAIHLDQGQHGSYDEGHCAMEVVAYLAGEGITDAPACASGVLQTYVISLNDQWQNGQRQKLKPYLPRMVGTSNDGQDEVRSYLALDWLIRSFTPAWLDLAGLNIEAQALRGLRRIADLATAKATGLVVDDARLRAAAARAAARAAAWAAARAAAWAAAWDAAGDAAGDAARAAAWAAARAAAGDAAWAAAGDAAGDAAWDAAGDAVGDAAGDAVGDAVGDAAWDAAWDAARAALQPTVEVLQASALDLLDRMIDPSTGDQ